MIHTRVLANPVHGHMQCLASRVCGGFLNMLRRRTTNEALWYGHRVNGSFGFSFIHQLQPN
jgi:hypothetical protein